MEIPRVGKAEVHHRVKGALTFLRGLLFLKSEGGERPKTRF